MEQVDRRLDELKADNSSMRVEIGGVKTDNSGMKTEIGNPKGELRLLRWMGGIVVAIQLGIWIRLLFM